MTKQTKTLTVLAAVLVVCGGAYAALRVWNDRQAQMDDTVYVTQLSDLTGLSLTNGQGELSFTKAEDAWQYDGDASFPAGQEAVEDHLLPHLGERRDHPHPDQGRGGDGRHRERRQFRRRQLLLGECGGDGARLGRERDGHPLG